LGRIAFCECGMGASLAEETGTLPISAAPGQAPAQPGLLLSEVAPQLDRVPPGTWAWFVVYGLWLLVWMAAALYLPERWGYADPRIMRVSMLAAMCLYLSVCNAFVPLPTAWIILLAASPGFSLVETGWLRVVLVATLAAASTVSANLTEYHLLAYLLHWGLGARLRRTRIYGWAVRWFDKAPFQLLLLIAFVPIPVDAVRWLAALRGYARGRFALAYFVGRWGRYALFAGFAVVAQLKGWQVAAIQVGLVCAALLARLLWRLVRRGGGGVVRGSA
jgi:membrane protein YqaA with SNARE-associated domain